MQLAAQHLAEIVETVKKMEAANNGSDKRRFPRFNVIARVEVMHGASKRVYTALTRDLSLEGVGLLQSNPLNKGDEFSISLPRGSEMENSSSFLSGVAMSSPTPSRERSRVRAV